MHGYVPPRSVVDQAVTKAIDDYLLMERKARAWDALRRLAEASFHQATLDTMDETLAQTVAPDTLKP